MVVHETTYNDRLFDGNKLRRKVHMARFEWLADKLRKQPEREYDVVEVGCFDGRILHHCVPPRRYEGFDADWEGGLTSAQSSFSHEPDWNFTQSASPSDLDKFDDKSFDVGLSLETMEHIDPDLVEGYVKQLARIVKGRVYITVPNEIGIAFALKRAAKGLMRHNLQPYTGQEWRDTVMGRTETVERDGHKGFNYNWLAEIVGRHMKLRSVDGLSANSGLPKWTSLTIGIIADAKD